MKSRSFLLVVGIIAALVVGFYAGYQYIQKSQLDGELESLDKTLTSLENEVLKYENQNLIETIAAKETLDALSLDAIQWSDVIRSIRRTVPKDSRGLPILDIVSYAGSGGRDISLSVATLDDDEPYMDVADFIEAFDESSEFEANFVPSVAVGIDPEGQEILTFTFNTEYQTELEDLEAAISEVLTESLEDTGPVAR